MALYNNKWLTSAEGVLKNTSQASGNIYSYYQDNNGKPIHVMPLYNWMRHYVAMGGTQANDDMSEVLDTSNFIGSNAWGGSLGPFADKNVINFPPSSNCISLGGSNQDQYLRYLLFTMGGAIGDQEFFKFSPSKSQIHFGFWWLSGHDYSSQNPFDAGALTVKLTAVIEGNTNRSDLDKHVVFTNSDCTVKVYSSFNADTNDQGTTGFMKGIKSWNIVDLETPLLPNNTNSYPVGAITFDYQINDNSAWNVYIGAPYICCFGQNERNLADNFDPTYYNIY